MRNMLEKTCDTCNHGDRSGGAMTCLNRNDCHEYGAWEEITVESESSGQAKKHVDYMDYTCAKCKHEINNECACPAREAGIREAWSYPTYKCGYFEESAVPEEGTFEPGGVIAAGAGLKYDDGKLRYSLLPMRAVTEVVKVLEYGAKKYTENSWQNVEPIERYYDAALRHLFAWKEGEKMDGESGEKHLAHAACNLLFMLRKEMPND